MAGRETPSTTTPTHRIGTIERTFALLQAVVAANGSVGVRELERRTGIPRSSVSRIVGTLTELGMVDRSPGGDVRPGAALATLRPSTLASAGIRDRLRPLLIELVDRFGESAALTIDDGSAVQYILQVASPHAVQAPSVEDERHDFHLVAPGLVHMASWSRRRLGQYLKAPLDSATEHSLSNPEGIAERLDRVRETGWVWTNQELDNGVNGLAVPIVLGGETVASVSLFGPAYRFAPELLPDLAPDLAEVAAERAATYL